MAITNVAFPTSSRLSRLLSPTAPLSHRVYHYHVPTAVDIDEVVEGCISKLMSVKSMRPGTEVALTADEIAVVVKRAREVFLSQPMLLEVCIFLCVGKEAPVVEVESITSRGGRCPFCPWLMLVMLHVAQSHVGTAERKITNHLPASLSDSVVQRTVRRPLGGVSKCSLCCISHHRSLSFAHRLPSTLSFVAIMTIV